MGFEKALHCSCPEGHRALQHDIEQHAERPYIDEEAAVLTIARHFWGQVCWRAALLLYDFIFVYEAADSEVTNFYTAIAIEENIIQFNISMQH